MINQDFFNALVDLEKENGISQQEFISALEDALVIAYKKATGLTGGVEIRLNPEKRSIKLYSVKKVVAEVVDPDKEISVEEAQAIKKSYKEGDVVSTEFNSKEFGRIAAQTARQVLIQKLHEIERENTVSEFEDKEGELMACTIRRIEDGNVYVEVGANQIEGVLLPKDQVAGEKYEVNQKINVYVKRVKNTGRTAQIMVSRTANGLVKRLFENEVPEIKQGIVLVKGVAREPGQRTKIAIYSEDPMVDALGACVGNKGARVNAIVNELGGEKVDVIPYSTNPSEYIVKALSPAKVIMVQLNETTGQAKVIVPDDKLSLAIGKGGQNAKLAAKLTGYKIDVSHIA